MNTVYINRGKINSIFNDLQEHFNGDLRVENNSLDLQFNSKIASGSINGTSFNKGISYLEFDMFFNDDTILSMETSVNFPILFAYCNEGSFQHSFGFNSNKETIQAEQSGILSNTSNLNSVLHFKGCKRVQFVVITSSITKIEDLDEYTLINNLKNKFFADKNTYSYVGEQSMLVQNKFQDYYKVPRKGVIGNLVKKKILLSILEIELNQHSFGYNKMIDSVITVAAKQFEEVKKMALDKMVDFLGWIGVVEDADTTKMIKERIQVNLKNYSQKQMPKSA